MTEQPEKVSVQIKYKDVEQAFSASPEQTWLALNKFFKDFIPKFDIANRLWLSPDLGQLSRDIDGMVSFSPEGCNLLLTKSKLTDNEAIILWLIASYLSNRLSLLSTDSLSKEELQEKLGKSGKITSTRLGELIKTGSVSKTQDGRFKITTYGIAQAQKETLPKIRARTKT